MNISVAKENEKEKLFALRQEVFVDEQNVPPEIEIDEFDNSALHIAARDGENVIGCARLVVANGEGHIGRLAVKREHRGRGVGAAICRFIIDLCLDGGITRVTLNSQAHAVGFYERLGFERHGAPFMEAGIEHIAMILNKERINMNEAVRILKERKSTKSYLSEHIDRAVIDEIVAAGLNAPSGRNMQTPIFAVVTDDETAELLSRLNAAVLGMKSDPFYGARDIIVVLAKKESPNYIYDGSLAMGNLLNAAYALGVGACWIHRAKEVFDGDEGKALLKAWGIEYEVEGIGFCILGREKEAKPKTEIKPGRVYYI